MLDLAALSYLGLGVQPPTADWGTMLSEGQLVLLNAPHLALAAGLWRSCWRCWASICSATVCAMCWTPAGTTMTASHPADRRPRDLFRDSLQRRPGSRRRRPGDLSRRSPGPGRRIRLREKRHRALDHAPGADAARATRLRAASSSTARICRPCPNGRWRIFAAAASR